MVEHFDLGINLGQDLFNYDFTLTLNQFEGQILLPAWETTIL